jgi:hypothetical protein
VFIASSSKSNATWATDIDATADGGLNVVFVVVVHWKDEHVG